MKKTYIVYEVTGWHINPLAHFQTRDEAEAYAKEKRSDLKDYMYRFFKYTIKEVNHIGEEF